MIGEHMRKFEISEQTIKQVSFLIRNARHEFKFDEIAAVLNSLESLKEIEEKKQKLEEVPEEKPKKK